MKVLLLILLITGLTLQQTCQIQRSKYTNVSGEKVSNQGGIVQLDGKVNWYANLVKATTNSIIRFKVKLDASTRNYSQIIWAVGFEKAPTISYSKLTKILKVRCKMDSNIQDIEVTTSGEIFDDFVEIMVKFTETDFSVYYQGQFKEQKPYPYRPSLEMFNGNVDYDFGYNPDYENDDVDGQIKDVQIVQDVNGDQEICFLEGKQVEICVEDGHGNCSASHPQPPVDPCEDGLKNLQSQNVNIDFLIAENNGVMEHQYTIKFEQFIIKDGCYDIQLQLGSTPNHIPHTVESSLKQEIYANFESDQAVTQGCVQHNPRKLECEFKLVLNYQGVEQMTKKFTSIVSTESLDNIQNGLQLQVISDSSDQIKTIGANVETEVNICEDSTCSSYKNELKMVRNEISYIEMKVNTPQYTGYYPVHKSLKLNSKEFLPENLQEVQSWQQPGKIIYQVKPHIASDSIYLMIQISLQSEQPNSGNRFLQQQQQQKQQPSNKDLLGKQVMVIVIDKEDLKSEEDNGNSDTALILGITLGSLAFVSFSVSTVAFVVLKMKKLSLIAQGSKITPQIDVLKDSQQQITVAND